MDIRPIRTVRDYEQTLAEIEVLFDAAFEVRGQASNITVIDDYAHHPREIAPTVAAVRAKAIASMY